LLKKPAEADVAATRVAIANAVSDSADGNATGRADATAKGQADAYAKGQADAFVKAQADAYAKGYAEPEFIGPKLEPPSKGPQLLLLLLL
jgi:membrane protein involved in colicin uptake